MAASEASGGAGSFSEDGRAAACLGKLSDTFSDFMATDKPEADDEDEEYLF